MVSEKELKEEEKKAQELLEKVREEGQIQGPELKDLNKKIQRYTNMNTKRMPERLREKLFKLMRDFNERAEEVYGT